MKILFHTTEEFLHSKKTKKTKVDKFNPNICLTFLFLGNSALAFFQDITIPSSADNPSLSHITHTIEAMLVYQPLKAANCSCLISYSTF